jgi:putative ABC transport system substrate-binding protein
MKPKSAISVLITFSLLSLCQAEAQQTPKTMPRVGFIFPTGAPKDPSPWLDAFQQGLRDLGYVEGKNLLIERRYAEGRLDRMPPFVHELVQQKVDVIVAVNNVVIRAAKEATTTIPIVMISSVDPVLAGYVENFAHPGGNITGLAWLLRDISAKRVELLKDLVPKLSRVGLLWDADGPGPAIAVKDYKAAARAFKIDFLALAIRGPNPEFAGAFEAAKTARLDALIVVANPLMAQHAKKVFDLSTKYRLPSMTEEGRFVRAGGLMSYGPSLADLYRRAAGYVVDILKGGKPAELPVRLPAKFEIFINLKTAEQVGIVIPQHVMVQADKIVR